MFDELPGRYWLNADCGTIQLDIHLATVGQADPVSDVSRNDNAACLVNGRLHGIQSTIRMAEQVGEKLAARGLIGEILLLGGAYST